MAQLRQDFPEFEKRKTVILVVGPDGRSAFARYWQEHDLPFIGLPDPKHAVLDLYGQQIKIFKFGRMPAQLLVDRTGRVRFVHYGQDMTDIPSNSEVLAMIDQINAAWEEQNP
jgi:peroxiredoxin Q/BCP